MYQRELVELREALEKWKENTYIRREEKMEIEVMDELGDCRGIWKILSI